MRDLSVLRQNGELHTGVETRLLHMMTVQESLRQWLWLQRSFEWQLQQTSRLFDAKRREAMVELQARLSRLVA